MKLFTTFLLYKRLITVNGIEINKQATEIRQS